MTIKVNLDTDADAILLNYQGRLVSTPTRLAVDDGENLTGGATQGAGSNTSGSSGGNVLLTNATNFSQIQENPLPCLAHGTLIDIYLGEPCLAQDLVPGQLLKYQDRAQMIEQVQRLWCESLWFVKCGEKWFGSSGDHHLVMDIEQPSYKQIKTIQVGDMWPQVGGHKAAITGCEKTGVAGWVYRIYLKDDGTPESHWYEACGGIHENAKPIDER